MKASFYTESILYWLARGFSFAACLAPATWNTAFGGFVGACLYHLLGSRRTVAMDNLRAAFGETKTPAECRRILKGLFRNLGMTFMELARMPAVDLKYIERWVSISPESKENLDTALAKGHGVIHLAAHFGNWEMISQTGALKGYPSNVLAREQGLPKLNALLTQYRESKGCQVINKGFTIRQLIRGLQEGKVTGILADQDGGRNGVLAPFFGRYASTAPGTMALSLNTQAPLLPIFIVRTGGPAHTLIIEKPLKMPEEGSLETRIQQGVANYMQILERYVRQYPSQWLWLHRRWKSSPDRKVLLLTDGKAGHLSQLHGLAEKIQAAWEIKSKDDKRLESVPPHPLVEVKTVSVIYKNKFRRILLSLIASVVPRRFPRGECWLRWGLTPRSYSELRSAYANVSVSCGASTAAAHLLWAWGIRSKTIHITRVNAPSWRRFDLAVIPEHDRLPEGKFKNLLKTKGALSPAAQEDAVRKESWRKRLKLDKPFQVGLLLGGPARGVSVGLEQVERMLGGLLEACDSKDAQLLVSTSRRTPVQIEQRLQELLKDHPRCRLLTLVNRNDPGGLASTQEAVDCILGVAPVCVVSGDSISMLSEAMNRGKTVVSFYPERSGFLVRPPKYYRFLDQLKRQERVAVTDPAQVGQAVATALKEEGTNGHPGPETPSDPVVEFLTRWL